MASRSVLILCVLVFGSVLYQVESVLRTTFIEDLCYNSQHSVIDLKYDTSGILMSAPKFDPTESFECNVELTPPRGSSVVLSIYRYDLYSEDVLIIEDSDRHRIALMGYGVFKTEKKSVISEGKMRIQYKTGNKTSVHTRAGFQFTFTKVMKSPCSSNEFKCNNGYCVLKDYSCDGHNHCGDSSDQSKCDSNLLEPKVDPRPIVINQYPIATWVTLIAIAALIVGTVIVVTIVVLVRRAKKRKANSSAGHVVAPGDVPSVPQQTASSGPLQTVSSAVPQHNVSSAAPVHGSQETSFYNRVHRSIRGTRAQPRVEHVPKEQSAPERQQVPSIYPKVERVPKEQSAPERYQVPFMYPSLDQIPSAPELHGVDNHTFEIQE